MVRPRLRVRPAILASVVLALSACGGGSVVGTGISVPTGPQLDELGLTERCVEPRDSSCIDRALDLAEQILVNLGAAQPPVDPSQPLLAPFTIQVDRDPAWEWRAGDGSGGRTAVAIFDLAPFLASRGRAVIRIAGDDPAYPVPDDLARQLIDALFRAGD
jgi:hypothetical protein